MIRAIKGDITKVSDVDAIVNAANKLLIPGGGVDGAIHKAAGFKLRIKCLQLRGCSTGEAKITDAYKLPCRYIIHTVGPIWHGGSRNEDSLLALCYTNSLKLAVENNIKRVAFPSISTGVFRFPIKEAALIAVTTVQKFITENPGSIERVEWVLFDDKTYEIYQKEIENLPSI